MRLWKNLGLVTIAMFDSLNDRTATRAGVPLIHGNLYDILKNDMLALINGVANVYDVKRRVVVGRAFLHVPTPSARRSDDTHHTPHTCSVLTFHATIFDGV